MWRVLVPVDGSEAAMRAVGHVASFAKQVGRPEAHLVNVQHPVGALDRAFDGRPSEVHREEFLLRQDGERLLEAASSVLRKAGLPSVSRVELGDPAHVIADYAAKHHCDAIVMGTGGAGSVAGRVLGAVTGKVLHLTDVPVTLVR